MSRPVSGDAINRVERIDLRGFRGWTQKHSVALDADVVLVTAGNGRGKSSLIEALSRVLNGAAFHEDGDNSTLGVPDGWRLAVEAGGREIPSDDPDWRQRLDHTRTDVPEPDVLRRATVFLQDRLDEQFEGGSEDSRGTILSFLAPFPDWLRAYEDALGRVEQRWRTDVPRDEPAQAVPSALRRREQAAAESVRVIAPLVAGGALAEGSAVEHLARLARLATERDADPGDVGPWLDRLDDWLSQHAQWTEAHRRRVAPAAARVDAARRALRTHDADWPDLRSLATWARGIVDLDRVAELLSGLAGRPDRWADASHVRERLVDLPHESRARVPFPDEALAELAAEFDRVDQVRAGRYRDAVSAWATFWREREAERSAREAELAAAEAELDRLESDRMAAEATAALDRFRAAHQALRAAEGRQELARKQRERWARLQPLLAAVTEQRRWCEALRARQLDEAVAERLRAAMDAVMQHFVVAGLEGAPSFVRVQVDVNRAVRPALADERSLDTHASTGQKAQLALAVLLGSNALLQRWLPHRLLLLDDVSTALDLTNLAAECALLRKFAYTADEGRRRQVVIASHHDQLTHRLFDLLLPPGDYIMREVRITDWSFEHGPTVQQSMIKATGAATEESRRRLADRLGSAFAAPRTPRSRA